MEKKRLSKTLAAAGVASRRKCEEMIFEGKVSVNGQIVLVPQTLVSLPEDVIRVDDVVVCKEQQKVYYLLNKPFGFICSNLVAERKKRVIDLFPPELRLFTVGRLDRDTTGLLLVTNDGHFAYKVIHPRANIEKEYLIKTRQEITHEHLIAISKGAFVEGAFVKPIRCVKVRKGTLKVTVKEGRKREVRLFAKQAGLDVESLCRIRIGGLRLGTVPEGTYRPLTEREKEAIFKK